MVLNLGSLALRPKANPPAHQKRKGEAPHRTVNATASDATSRPVEHSRRSLPIIRTEEEAKTFEAPEAAEDISGIEASRRLLILGNSKRQEISGDENRLPKIVPDFRRLQKFTESRNNSRRSRKRRLSESEEESKCFDLEVEFMDRPYGYHLVPSLTIYISDSFSLPGVLATLLVLHSDHFASTNIDPENVWLVELFLPAKDTEHAPGEQVLVEDIDMEDDVNDNGEIWERFLKECRLDLEQLARKARLSSGQKSKRAKLRLGKETGTLEARSVEKATEEISKLAGPKICLHLNV